MIHAAESSASATLSGRELALKRRQAMALHGKAGIVRAAHVRPTASAPRASQAAYAPAQDVVAASQATAAYAHAVPVANVSVARARREALSTAGKNAVKQTVSARPTGRVRPQREVPLEAVLQKAGCGCGCDGTKPVCNTEASYSMQAASNAAVAMTGHQAAGLTPLAVPAGGRAFARARRSALSQDGKAGLKRVAQASKIAVSMPGQDWQAAITKGATGRQVSMQHRRIQSLAGREGSSSSTTEKARPSGRMRVREAQPVPAKVEEGHTLSGQSVTGTMTDRSKKTTGTEPGSCRAVTGTEYVGSEQFDALCNARPEANPPKVGVSTTLREQRITGTEIGRSQRVTGDEPGACRGVTGTEYLSAERYAEFCDARPAPSPAKVGFSVTAKDRNVSGTTVGRSEKVTGNESGSDRQLTGTGYMQSAPDNAPDKVALTHTAQGKAVTGTAIGHTSHITGDEPGACRSITGTEYFSLEQFSTVCNTAPVEAPRKVSVMSTRAGEAVSGSEVGRAANVTGDEPGACRAITGNQYYTQSDFAPLCKTPSPQKVGLMHTLSGRSVSGTEVAPSPKLSGDESYGCQPVTGVDYIGADQLQAICPVGTQIQAVAKVKVDQTLRGTQITGNDMGRGERVTGNESGGCSPVSGSSYTGRNQFQGFCAAPELALQEARVRSIGVISASAVTGDRPGSGGSVMTGDERGACEPISGTPYVGVDNMAESCPTSGRFVSRARNFAEPERAPAPADFSIGTPARVAQRERADSVTGMGMNSDRITGPGNKANGLITGTPEFRHRDTVAAKVEQADTVAAARRLTGEGREASRLTGDSWDSQTRVTGTEGASSLVRNQSQRGNPRGVGVNAQVFREIERVELPESRITGSAGSSGKGAAITLSGGARG